MVAEPSGLSAITGAKVEGKSLSLSVARRVADVSDVLGAASPVVGATIAEVVLGATVAVVAEVVGVSGAVSVTDC